MRKFFRKHLIFGKMVLLDQIEYPGEVLFQLFLSLMPLLMMSYLWFTVYSSQNIVAGFNLKQIITYYFIVLIINRLQGHTAFWVSDFIKDGTLSSYLVKPFGFLKYVFLHAFLRRVVNLGISLPVILIVYLILRDNIELPITISTYFGFFLILIPSILIYYLLGITLGLIGFWTFEIGSLFYFFYGFLGFIGGSTLPLSFFPQQFINVINVLPFKYLFFYPTQVLLGKVDTCDFIVNFGFSLFWTILLILLVKLIWKMGIKRYTSVGG